MARLHQIGWAVGLNAAWLLGADVSAQALFPTDNWPPTNSVYFHPPEYVLVFEQGTRVRNLELSQMQGGGPLPTETFTLSFSCAASFEYSGDDGQTWLGASGLVEGSIRGTPAGNDGDTRLYDTELLTMDVTLQGPLEGSLMRENPEQQSLGRMSVRPTSGGFLIESSFQVLSELKVFHTPWSPALSAMPMNLRGTNAVDVRLAIERLIDGSVRVCWPNPSNGFRLQGAVALDDWTDIAEPPVTDESMRCVTLAGGSSHRFFRLALEVP